MGAYLEKPNREKDSVDYDGDLFSYGASSMQGWRVSQEDAHNCCENFDGKTALFAVYDGHGGAEVAQYTAVNFPDFIKQLSEYKEGRISQALEDAFLKFDAKLTEEDVIHELKELAGFTEMAEEEVQSEVAGLFEEADMPLEELLERYKGGGGPKAIGQHLKKNLLNKEYVPSPALRGKKDNEEQSLKDNSEDIKANLDEKLVNGELDCNGHQRDSETETNSKTEVTKSETNSKTEVTKSETNSKTEVTKSETNSKTEVTKSGSETKTEGTENESETDKKEQVSKIETIPETTEVGGGDSSEVSGSAKGDEGQEETNNGSGDGCVSTSQQISQDKTLPDSTQADSSSNCSTTQDKGKAGGDANGESEVSSSSGSRSQTAGSHSNEGGSGSGFGASATEVTAPDSSFKQTEPCSSTGRKRSGKTSVIPKEGEDESSFDEDEESSSEYDSEDMEGLVEDDSEDELEGEEELDGEEDDEEDEDTEDGTGVVYGQEEPGSDSGCTAVMAILRGTELFVANAGDSRCVVCRDGKAINMSFDHKPEDELELNRIVKAGGQVTPEGRVDGGLNLSRAIGDHTYKRNADLPLKDQMITALPDVRTLKIEEKDEFMILACDGIWNSLNSQDTVNFVRDRLKTGVTKLSTICEEMFEFCIAPNTLGDGTGCDNMTAIIVKFSDKLKQSQQQTEGGAIKRPASSSEDSSITDTNSTKKVKEGD